MVVATKGNMKYKENWWAFQSEPESSMQLKTMMERAMTSDWPASSPFTPAKMLMALVQNTANIPMYT